MYAGIKHTIPMGQLGLLTDVAPSDVPPGALIRANNIALNASRAQKAPGAIAFNEIALPAGIVGCVDWQPNTVQQRLIAACANGNLYIDSGVGARSFKTAPLNASVLTGLNPNCQFIAGGNETSGREKKLFFISRGQNQIQVLAGNNEEFEPIASPAADWTDDNFPRCGVLHRNHLYVFAGQTAYASDTGDHENFTSGDFQVQQVFPGEGGDIIAAFVYKGRLFCFKNAGFGYWLDDANEDSDLWVWKQLSSSFGVSATNAITQVLDDLISGNETGTATSYQATQMLGDVAAADIFQTAQIENFLRGNSSKAGLDVQHMLYYAEKKQVFLTYRSGYFTYNDMLIVIDLNKQGTPRITFWTKGRPQCLALRKDATNIKRPMYGSTDGRIYFMDREDRNEGGDGYLAEFQTGHMDFRWLDGKFADTVKLFDNLAVTYVPEGNWNLNCDYFIDGKYIDTITFPMIQYQKPQLDVLMLSTDRLGQANTETVARKLTGSGRTISFRFWNDGEDQSFQIASITVGFRPAGNQTQKTE